MYISNTIYKSRSIFLQLRQYCHIGKNGFKKIYHLHDKLYCFIALKQTLMASQYNRKLTT